MKTMEVIEYLIKEASDELHYKVWYFGKLKQLEDECNEDKYYKFLCDNRLPKSSIIKQNLSKIRKLTLKMEKELK